MNTKSTKGKSKNYSRKHCAKAGLRNLTFNYSHQGSISTPVIDLNIGVESGYSLFISGKSEKVPEKHSEESKFNEFC